MYRDDRRLGFSDSRAKSGHMVFKGRLALVPAGSAKKGALNETDSYLLLRKTKCVDVSCFFDQTHAKRFPGEDQTNNGR